LIHEAPYISIHIIFYLHIKFLCPIFKNKGIITSSEDNQPIIGAIIVEKGTNEGSASNENGIFEILVNSIPTTLIVSYIGFDAYEIIINDQSNVSIALLPASNLMNELLVVGYKSEIRSEIASSVSSIKSRELSKLVVTGLDQALQGQAAGVMVTQVTGFPGDDIAVRIRGAGTLGNNNPLYVIDGIPTTGGLNMFSISDIESMEVLKDAAAASIYGARAANGVVLITTKRGKSGKTIFNFETYRGIQQPVNLPNLLNAKQYLSIRNEAITNANTLRNQANQIPTYNEKILDTLQDNNWLDIMFKPASMQRYALSAKGGSENGSYYISGEYLSQEGIFKGQKFEKFQLRLNSDTGKGKFRVGNNVVLSHSDRKIINGSGDGYGPGNELSGIRYTLITAPVFKKYRADGSYVNTSTELGDPTLYGDGNPNPLAFVDNTDWTVKRYRAFGNVYAAYEIMKGLNIRSTLGGDLLFDQEKLFKKRLSLPSTILHH
jgi:TonB-dependent starch-binding outer membrane protein SusC